MTYHITYVALCEACGVWHEGTLMASDARSQLSEDSETTIRIRCLLCNGRLASVVHGNPPT